MLNFKITKKSWCCQYYSTFIYRKFTIMVKKDSDTQNWCHCLSQTLLLLQVIFPICDGVYNAVFCNVSHSYGIVAVLLFRYNHLL